MSRMKNIVRAWLPLVVVVTALTGLVYLTAQQVLRQDANDPQIQMAEDAAAALDRGTAADAIVPPGRVELATSLAPFVVLYDANGKPLSGSGMLDGALPDYPMGALQASKQGGENRVTWQPREGVRVASVVVPTKAGYVVAGRSLREVEQREAQAQQIAFAAWLAALAAMLVAVAFGEFVLR